MVQSLSLLAKSDEGCSPISAMGRSLIVLVKLIFSTLGQTNPQYPGNWNFFGSMQQSPSVEPGAGTGSTSGAVPHHSQGSCLGTGHSVDTGTLQCNLWDEASSQHHKRYSAASFPTPSPSFLLVIQTLGNLTIGTQVLD